MEEGTACFYLIWSRVCIIAIFLVTGAFISRSSVPCTANDPDLGKTPASYPPGAMAVEIGP